MQPRVLLRLEGLVAVGIALAGYIVLEGPIWLFLVLILAPDLSMLGYLAGPRWGSRSYNAVHTYAFPLLLGAGAYWFDSPTALLIALVWIAHIGADRLMGYGLKYPTGFKDTHLATQPPPLDVLESGE